VKNPIPFLRKIALLEGISFLVLVGIAMPLKYLMDLPSAVKVTGWIHGLLFTALCVLLARTTWIAKWPVTRAALIFIASLLPFGPFLIDRRIIAYEREFQEKFGVAPVPNNR
jgi:integral membrane protein